MAKTIQDLYVPEETRIVLGVPLKFRKPDTQCIGIYTRLILMTQEIFFSKKLLASKGQDEIFSLCGEKISNVLSQKDENNNDFIRLILCWSTNGGFDLMGDLIGYCFPDVSPRLLTQAAYSEAFGIAAQEIAKT